MQINALALAIAFFGAAALVPGPVQARKSLRQLVKELDRTEGDEKARVIRAIGNSRVKKRGAKALLKVFDIRKGSPRDSSAIVSALGELGHPSGAGPLVEAWDYLLKLRFRLATLPPHLQLLRAALIEALGRIGDEKTVPVLRRGLIDDNPRVVQRSAEALALMRDEDSVPMLIRLLGSQNSDIAQSAYEALGGIGGGEAERVLRAALENKNAEVRVAASYGLARMQQKIGVLMLDGFLEEVEEPYKEGVLAAYYLGRLGRSNGVEYLVAIARDADSPLRLLAVGALGKTGAGGAVVPLAEIARDEDPEVRMLAALALGRLPGMRARHALKILKKDPEEKVRGAARSALAAHGVYDPL